MENGFVQCFAEVDGRSARIMDYAPGQQLQPHIHDIDEVRDDCPRVACVTEGHGKPFQLIAHSKIVGQKWLMIESWNQI